MDCISIVLFYIFFFFFKQKTAYEMRISDWSSDVCSSDLLMATAAPEFYAGAIADALGFDAIVASRHHRDDAGNWLPLLDGTNCYGEEKARRVGDWLAAKAPGGTAHIRAFSDHVRDRPTFSTIGREKGRDRVGQ